MSSNHPLSSFRRGVLVDPPDENLLGPKFNWGLSVIGVFFGSNPPSLSIVQYTVDSQWCKRDLITVIRRGKYFGFLCKHPRDVEAMLEQNTAIIDGRIITFRRGSRNLVPYHENFDNATLWVRVCGLPLDFLDREWALEALRHVGYVEELDEEDYAYHDEPEYRAKVRLDLSQPLIPGCYIPLGGNQAAWVYFRYEGVFKFCKRCGVVGHFTCNCTLTEYRASRWIKHRLEGLESSGFRILYGPPDLPFYTNMVQGLLDSFRNRNTRVNLLSLGFNVTLDPPAFHGGFGIDENVVSPANEASFGHDIAENNNVSSESEPEYFPATESLHSQDDYLVSNVAPPSNVNAWQSYEVGVNTHHSPGRRFGLNNDPYAPYFPSATGFRSVSATFELGQSSKTNMQFHSVGKSSDDESDQTPIGTITQQPEVTQTNHAVGSTHNINVSSVDTRQPAPNPFAGVFTSGGEPFIEGRPHMFHDGVFTPIILPVYPSVAEGSTHGVCIHSRTSSVEVEPSLSPTSSFAELSLGTFHVVAPEMEDSDTSNSSSSSVKATKNCVNKLHSGKRARSGQLHRSHSENSACSLDYVPSDWFTKRRKMRIKKWEHKGGLGMWKKRHGKACFESKCFTDLSLARDFGVEVSPGVSSFHKQIGDRKKRGSEQQLGYPRKKSRVLVLGLQAQSQPVVPANVPSSSSTSAEENTNSGLVTGRSQSPSDP